MDRLQILCHRTRQEILTKVLIEKVREHWLFLCKQLHCELIDMLKLGLSVLLPLVGFHFLIDRFQHIHKVPKLDEDDYFGNASIHADDISVRDFEISIDEVTIQDLKNRLKYGLDRYYPQLEDNFELGVNYNYLKNISESLLNFNWKQHEYFLNTFKHGKTEIEGIGVHFLRANYPLKTSQRKYPLLLIHGYPNSFWDFYKILPILANPTRFGFDFGTKETIVFDVIVPSIPGFAFSDKPSKPGFGFVECARIFGKLMERLGHDRYFIHGSSAVGSQIGSAMAAIQPKSILGLHMSDPYFDLRSSWMFMAKFYWSKFISSFSHHDRLELNIPEEFCHDRPDTLGIVLNDSPVGAAAFLMDRWAAVTSRDYKKHPQGGLQSHYTLDEVLTEVYIYLLTNTCTHAARFLYNSRNHPLRQQFSRATIDVPTGIINFPEATHRLPQSLLELKYRNISRYVDASKGGELAAIENGKELTKEIFSFVEHVTL